MQLVELSFFFFPTDPGSPADPEDSLSVWGGATPSGWGRTFGLNRSWVFRIDKLIYFDALICSLQGEDAVEVQPVFAACLQAELVPASVQDYREKLLHLRKLRYDLVQRTLPLGPDAIFQQVLRKRFPAGRLIFSALVEPKLSEALHVYTVHLCLICNNFFLILFFYQCSYLIL